MKDKKAYAGIVITGAVIGLIAVALVLLGNPKNMGFCIACFLRDIAGATKLHTTGTVQYFRPEIVGLVGGALAMALIGKEFSPKGGSAPVTRFFLGAFVMIGALVFLGCPLRMVLRIGGGDLNAVVGLVGFACGILGGIFFLNKGFSLKRTYKMTTSEAVTLPIGLALLFVVAGIRDLVLFKDWKLLLGFVTIIVAALIGNLATGNFNLGFSGQPIAHSVHLWNFMGMLVVGLGSVLLGGCPLRQLILTGEGNTDSAVTVLGYIVGAAFAHNFGLAGAAATADSIGGPSTAGKAAVIIGLIVMLVIAAVNTFKAKKNA